MSSFIRIDGWKTNIRFSSAHVIPEYEKCGRLHGHTYAIHTKIFGSKDEKGIIIDFSNIKNHLKEIANNLDHRILIPRKSSLISIEERKNNITLNMMNKRYVFPDVDCKILPLSSTSAENLAEYILERLLKKIENEKHISKIEIGVDEGFGQGAFISKKILI
jgi:6-pyruvoyltetrahydropterin/6-carboxytetrahydropterin synthase